MWRIPFLGMAPIIVSGYLTHGPDGVLHGALNDKLENHAHGSDTMYAINVDGSTKWTVKLDPHPDPQSYNNTHHFYGHAEGINGTVYAITSWNELLSVDALDGGIKWKYTAPYALVALPQYGLPAAGEMLVARDNTVYLVESTPRLNYSSPYENILHAIDSKGALKWSFNYSDSLSQATPPVLDPDGTPWVMHSGLIEVIHPDTGTVKWSMEAGSQFHLQGRLTFAADGSAFLVHYEDASWKVTRLSIEDGSILGKVSFSPRTRDPLSVKQYIWFGSKVVNVEDMTEDETCILRVYDFDFNNLSSFPCFDVSHRWKFGSVQNVEGAKEEMFVAVQGNSTVARSGTDGHVVWDAHISVQGMYDGLIVGQVSFGQDGTVFVWNAGGPDWERYDLYVYAIRNGKEAWSVQSALSSTLTMADGTTYVEGTTYDDDLKHRSEIIAVGADGFEMWRYNEGVQAAVVVV